MNDASSNPNGPSWGRIPIPHGPVDHVPGLNAGPDAFILSFTNEQPHTLRIWTEPDCQELELPPGYVAMFVFELPRDAIPFRNLGLNLKPDNTVVFSWPSGGYCGDVLISNPDDHTPMTQ